jgi:hypothetical protein
MSFVNWKCHDSTSSSMETASRFYKAQHRRNRSRGPWNERETKLKLQWEATNEGKRNSKEATAHRVSPLQQTAGECKSKEKVFKWSSSIRTENLFCFTETLDAEVFSSMRKHIFDLQTHYGKARHNERTFELFTDSLETTFCHATPALSLSFIKMWQNQHFLINFWIWFMPRFLLFLSSSHNRCLSGIIKRQRN